MSRKFSKKRILPAAFYARSTVAVALDLLGTVLVHRTVAGLAAGRIVETEAYLQGDPASHSCRGRTPRSLVMWGPPGVAYVYLSYGMYHCFNLVTETEGKAGAVLVRALEPLGGLALMQARRKTDNIANLTTGPGKLCQALGISREDNGAEVTRGSLTVLESAGTNGAAEVAVTPRIGISQAQEAPLRFTIAGHEFLSRRHHGEVILRGTAEAINEAFASGKLKACQRAVTQEKIK